MARLRAIESEDCALDSQVDDAVGSAWSVGDDQMEVAGEVSDSESAYEIRALSTETWDAFAELVERHNGGRFGGCWCTWFHRPTHSAPVAGQEQSAERTRAFKRDLVETGRAHAALVFDGEKAVGWAQYGSPDELPGIAHRKEVEAEGSSFPDWRITCVFVDRLYRRRGVARIAVEGALDLIPTTGGGTVESYPQDTSGKKVSASFLYNATRTTFEQAGSSYQRPKGKNHCIVRTSVAARVEQ
ncbi:GNAT family N-acetyltransferase [uncultured Amnibacterium sp.]|uniref:GNAT family N-acetyltransferase n=1 Tax=uncultured Amnibacterium sp. TaxID=1631851 RepID=UPI0035C94B65